MCAGVPNTEHWEACNPFLYCTPKQILCFACCVHVVCYTCTCVRKAAHILKLASVYLPDRFVIWSIVDNIIGNKKYHLCRGGAYHKTTVRMENSGQPRARFLKSNVDIELEITMVFLRSTEIKGQFVHFRLF